MDMTALVDLMSNLIYPMQGIAAVYGMFLVVLIYRRIGQKQFRSQAAADDFLNQISERLQARQFDDVVALCDSPPYWSKAVPQLILIAMANRHWPINKLRQLLSETFEREVLAEMDYQMSWVNTDAGSARDRARDDCGVRQDRCKTDGGGESGIAGKRHQFCAHHNCRWLDDRNPSRDVHGVDAGSNRAVDG